MKKLSIGIQTFSHLIEQNCVYVDKTALIYQLITQGSYYCLSRPRRFGKSLLVSTLAAIFSGKKELFVGLAINSLPYDWVEYPVVHISFASIAHRTPEQLENGIKLYLQDIAKQYNIIISAQRTSGESLMDLVRQLSQKNRVVLLIDEYDYAILQHIHKPEEADNMRIILRDFYAVIKDLDPYVRFVFLTGVSRFSKTSIFSGLNNLLDISLSTTYNTLLGYTYTEIITYFKEHIAHTTHILKYPHEQLLQEIKIWYDGYLFTHDTTTTHMYNPFSVLLFFENNLFSNYWFETGTPTFLINLLKTKEYPLQSFDMISATSGELGQFTVDDIELKTLLFQTGYITIKSYNPASRNYILGYTNKETMDSLAEHIIKAMTGISQADFRDSAVSLLEAFKQHDFKKIFSLLTDFFVSIPYTIQIAKEKYYQTIFYLILKMIGAHIIVEKPTNAGRIDAVLQTKNTCFVIEFKINSTAAKALRQIETKKYYQPYVPSGKKIILIGIAFDTTIKNISELKSKSL